MYLLEEMEVDVVDDAQMTGKHRLQKGHRPALESLGQHGVIGVRERANHNVPRLLPSAFLTKTVSVN